MKAQQVRQRSMPPDPAAHNFPRSSTPGPAAPIYHRLRAASVSGAGSSSDRRRPAEPPSTPRATRATPPAPSASSAREIHDFTLDDHDHGVEYWKTRAIRAEAQTDRNKDELRLVRAEADALRERAAAAERELIICCGAESDRSRSRSASRAPSLRPGRMGARQREKSIKEEPEEPSDVVMEKEEEEDSEVSGLNRPVQKGDESWAANLTPGEMILLGNKIRKML